MEAKQNDFTACSRTLGEYNVRRSWISRSKSCSTVKESMEEQGQKASGTGCIEVQLTPVILFFLISFHSARTCMSLRDLAGPV